MRLRKAYHQAIRLVEQGQVDLGITADDKTGLLYFHKLLKMECRQQIVFKCPVAPTATMRLITKLLCLVCDISRRD